MPTQMPSAALFGSSGTLTGVLGQTLTLSGTGTLAGKNVNTQQSFPNLSGFSLGDGTGGGLASNYTLAGGMDWVNIYACALDGHQHRRYTQDLRWDRRRN